MLASGRSCGRRRRRRRGAALLLVLAATLSGWLHASGPRWVAGPPYFWPTGFSIAWYTNQPLYFTDPGDLSASVPHAAADAMVARAAAVWNIPQSSLVLAQGGSLDEHVTGAMIAAGGSTPTMPADVQSSNYQNKQIAVIYDTDGSVIDALLGAGGSDPSGCLQTGVVESVDSFGQTHSIQHALLILNGRCTGPEPEKQLQMQYQLMRAFGRILGVGWSQTNDNVFTQSPAPTYNQALNWPVMHPIDINCGAYTYQCMPQPFTLRPDDIASLASLYYIWQGQGAGMPGKEDTLANGSELDGYVSFPNGQGMEGVNVTVRRKAYFAPSAEDWQTVSSVSGYSFRRQTGTPVAGQDGSAMSSIGTYEGFREGYWRMERIPIPTGDPWQTMIVTTEPINPLYTGPYALTTQAAASATMAPSGSMVQVNTDIAARYYFMSQQLTLNDAVSSCAAGADGTETAPVDMAASGWWTGVLCGYNHSSWAGLSVKANRTATVEVTALDETGAASPVKAMPMIGLWQATDATGQAPTVGATPVAFNSGVVGMSSLGIQSTANSALRMTITDQRGAGRPDFAYQARVLYADAVTPANVGASGGTVVISGTGFRAGNTVTVNGVPAAVTGVTATAITVTAPSLRALGSTRALLATVVVQDPTTGGSSVMTSALGYGSPGERLQLQTVPSGTVLQGRAAGTPFAVLVLAADGITPVANELVTFSVSRGFATFGVCGAVSCTVRTSAAGVASTSVTPTTTGSVTLVASTSLLSVQTTFSVSAAPDSILLVSAPAGVATVGSAAPLAFAVRVLAGDGVTPRVGQTVSMTAENGAARLEACGAASCSLRTDATGSVATAVTPLVPGRITLDAVGAAGTVSSSFSAGREQMLPVSAPSGYLRVGTAAAVPFAVRVVGGDGVTPVSGESVIFSAIGGAIQFGACGGASCTVSTNAQGLASSTVLAGAVGTVTLSAAAASGSATASLIAGAETMSLVTAPSGSVNVGSAAPVLLAVRVLGVDGVSPVSGEVVSLRTTTGSALLGACGGARCDLATNASGLVSTTVTPTSAGTVVVTAISVAGTQTATLLGLALPDLLQVVSAPTGTLYVGSASSPGVSVRLLLADGTTPVAGQPVTFTVSGGAGSFGACASAVCTVVTDANGLATTPVTALAAGQLLVLATAAAATQAQAQTVALQAVARSRTLNAVPSVVYVAEGAPATWPATVALSDNALATDGVAVQWASSNGLVFSQGTSLAAGGVATVAVTAAALGAGVQATGQACAWSTLCASLVAQGVSATEWRVVVVSGAAQQGRAGDALSPVVVRVTDLAGHPLVQVPVQVHQTQTGWQQACPALGRCPAPPVLSSVATAATTDGNGLLTIPLAGDAQVAGTLEIAITAGTAGTATAVLQRQP